MRVGGAQPRSQRPEANTQRDREKAHAPAQPPTRAPWDAITQNLSATSPSPTTPSCSRVKHSPKYGKSGTSAPAPNATGPTTIAWSLSAVISSAAIQPASAKESGLAQAPESGLKWSRLPRPEPIPATGAWPPHNGNPLARYSVSPSLCLAQPIPQPLSPAIPPSPQPTPRPTQLNRQPIHPPIQQSPPPTPPHHKKEQPPLKMSGGFIIDNEGTAYSALRR